ncbi:hypothetical protein BJ165DRAFT_743223 [Panaeolus papilionaceus]|nr:hypothetical protein BJ165DRAFT_743223 [Panaeolus papilionaceus]
MLSVSNPLLSPTSFVHSGFRETSSGSARLSSTVFEFPSAKRQIRPIAPIPFIRSDNPGSSPQPIPSSPLPTTPLPNTVSYNLSPIAFPVSPLPVTPTPWTQTQPQAQTEHHDPNRLLSPAQPLRIAKRNGLQRTPRCEPLSISHSHSKDSARWSDVVPPESALFFAVVWDDNDEIVAFSPADIARHSVVLGDGQHEEVVEAEFEDDEMDLAFYALESENDDHWDGVEVEVEGASEYDETESVGSATVTPQEVGQQDLGSGEQLTPTTSHYPSLNSSAYFQIIQDHGNMIQSHTPHAHGAKPSRYRRVHRKHGGHGVGSSSHSLSSSIPLSSSSAHGMTRTSSTLGGLDVYLKGLPLKKTHRNQPFYSVLEFELDTDLDARLRIDSINFADAKFTKASSSVRESKFSLPWTTIEPPSAEEIAMLSKEREIAREKAGKRLKKRSRWALRSMSPESLSTAPRNDRPSSTPSPAPSPRKRINKQASIPLKAFLSPSPRFPCNVPTSSPPNSPPARLTSPTTKQNGPLSIGIPNRLGGFPSLSRSSSTLRARSTTPSHAHYNRSRTPSHVHARPTNPQAMYFERQSQNMADSPVVGSGTGMSFCQPLFSNVFRLVGIGESGCKTSEGMGEWVVVDGASLTGRYTRM